MQPMGRHQDEYMTPTALDAARAVNEGPLAEDPGEDTIAMPETRYAIVCVKCGITQHLQMIPHRSGYDGCVVGWVFCCEDCRPAIVGKRITIETAEP